MSFNETQKQAIVLRTDLKMRRGKEIAQGAHASMIAVLDFRDDPNVEAWLAGKFTKIALGVPDHDSLVSVLEAARAEGIPHGAVTDAGLTEFDSPTDTAVAVGPAPAHVVDRITGHLKLR